ncbi:MULTISPECIES: hypothetical protein [Lactobacillus]|uniref:Uncharacterized protein n=1 Tax=Lactobacillus xujianguonis TaxID=2495899 RepID=A0A437SW54_9LACO|nr:MULTISPECIES: hypothetical protein [Lactobacillus]RVU71154.1 hypothetical protein EJK17_03910 [Lactobacillus xujianguonis]RVU77501.1 hypothetical protein EJK20_01735 [Lactobacillus xujianguonis]
MGFIKDTFSDPSMLEDEAFHEKIREDGILLKVVQEIFPKEQIVSAWARFPDKKRDGNFAAKTDHGERIDIALAPADETNAEHRLYYMRTKLSEELDKGIYGWKLKNRTFYVMFCPFDPLTSENKAKHVIVLAEASDPDAFKDFFKSKLIVINTSVFE